MKQLSIFIIVVLSVYNTAAQPVKKRLDSLADYYYHTLDFNGTVLVTEKGHTLLDKGFGYQNKRKNLLNTRDGIYLIGSVTKQFTAEIILMLASEGKLSVKDKLSKYFPAYAYGDSITLENMLNQTSGIFDYTQDSTWYNGKLDAPISDERIFSLFWNKPLKYTPGTDWNYSNTNYKFLGLVIEQVTGKSYYQNVRERIFQPLGMVHSGFDFIHLHDKNKTTGYYRVRNDSFLVSIIVDSTQTNSAGAIYSNTADMFKWHNALQSNKLLSKEWQDKAYTPFRKNYAYGWEVHTINGKLVLSHSGHIHGYNSNFYRLPGEDVCIVVFTNLMKTAADPIAYARDLVRAMYDKKYVIPAVRKEIQLAESIKKHYEGVYVLQDDTSMLFTFKLRNKQLILNITGQGEIPLIPQSATMFFTKMVDAQVEFKKNGKGDYKMILHQYGQKLDGTKIREL